MLKKNTQKKYKSETQILSRPSFFHKISTILLFININSLLDWRPQRQELNSVAWDTWITPQQMQVHFNAIHQS